ncbi:hypothetical protein DPMN_143895, partial [Dreissena polymorpha]
IPPSKEVLSKLFGHVTCTGISGTTYIKNLSLFDTGLDPNPVFRSFLLQLIFKFSDIKCVTEYIKQFIQNSQSSNEENNLMGIYFLIVQCYEDFRRGHLGKDDDSDYNEVCKRITDAQEQFQKTEHPLEIEDVTKLLFCIGDVRVCLGIVGEYMANLFSKNVDVNLGKSSIIIQKARNLCEKNDWPRVFLAKQLCRGYGIEVYRGICNSSSGDLKWLAYNSAGDLVQAVIRSELDTNHVATFLLNHMYKNIKDLYQLIGLGADDVFLLMHHLLHHVALKIGPVGIRSSYANVETKQYRGLWESEFSQQVLKDVLSNLTVLTHLNQRLATDNRPGDPLMSRIYETEGSEVLNPDNLLEDSRMWMYRTPTTIEHMLQKLESVCSNVKRYPVLQLLMKKDKILQALRYVPNILNLVRTLLNRYLKKIDKVEALNVNIKTIKTVCRTGNGIADFPKEFCSKSITDETPLAVLLPSTVGPGLCSYAMLDFLFREQNAFLDDYIRMAGM